MQKKISFWRSIQFAYVAVLFLAFIFFISLSMLIAKDRDRLNDVIYSDRKAEVQATFDTIVDLDSQSLKDITQENTYWDDMVSFIEQPETEKSELFKEEVLSSQVDIYDAHAIWTYNKNFELTSNVNIFDQKLAGTELDIAPDEMKKMFLSSPAVHFYKETDSGILEIFGSTVHPSYDKDHLTPARGYFFFARKVEGEYIKLLSDHSGNIVKVLKSNEVYTLPIDFEYTEGRIAFYKDLKNHNDQIIGQMYVEYNASTIGEIIKSFDRLIFNIIAGYIILAVAVYFSIAHWMIQPLRKIYLSLADNSTAPLQNLVNNRSEFGRIANLIVSYFNQRDEITKAVKTAQNAQEKLEKRTQELEHTNSLMIRRELRMIELKKEISELKKQQKDNDE